jgi:PTH1 family peptidyl-tRNA hydrolase
MKLVVGLGNPGERYAKTRHNVGFRAVDLLATQNPGSSWQSKFDSLVYDLSFGEKVLLVKPMTFMNLSGRAVRKACDFYKVPPGDVFVICDDLSLPLGALRIRGNGSSGGQNGLKDIIAALVTEEFARLRIGIGDRGRLDAADFVLSDFRPDELREMDNAVIDAASAAETWCRQGLQSAMNRFNRSARS